MAGHLEEHGPLFRSEVTGQDVPQPDYHPVAAVEAAVVHSVLSKGQTQTIHVTLRYHDSSFTLQFPIELPAMHEYRIKTAERNRHTMYEAPRHCYTVRYWSTSTYNTPNTQ